jgi:Tol biopolymer transport system component
MRPERHRVVVLSALVLLLSGCIFWPPYGFPTGDETIVVENRSDADLVLRLTGADLFPMAFAISASTTGEIAVFLVEPPITVDLLDTECNEISSITLDDAASYLAIEPDGSIVLAPDEPAPASERQFVEFIECDAFGMEPELEDHGMAGITGQLIVSGGPNGDLWAVSLPDGPLEQLTDGDAWDGPGSVAPDGTVAFTRMDATDFTGAVWTIGSAETDARRLRDEAMNPAWSPDGSRIGFIDGDPFGGGLVVLDPTSGAETAVTNDLVLGFSWAPAGDRLAFVVPEAGADPMSMGLDGRVYVASPGDLPTVLARLPAVGPLAWSPDGSMIAVEGFDGFASTITVVDATSGSEAFAVDAGSSYVTGAAWSPTGDRLLYVRTDATSFEQPAQLMSVPAGGGEPEEVADLGDVSTSSPVAWSSSGDLVAVAGMSMSGGGSVWIVNVDTGEAARVMTGADGLLGWR